MLTFTPPSNLEQSTSVDCVRTLKHLEGGHTDMRRTCKPHTEPTVRWQCYNYCTTMLQVKYASTTWLTKQAMQEFFPSYLHVNQMLQRLLTVVYIFIWMRWVVHGCRQGKYVGLTWVMQSHTGHQASICRVLRQTQMGSRAQEQMTQHSVIKNWFCMR